jgi:hypothetical protein
VISCATIIPAKGLEFSLFTSNFNHLADVSLTSSSWEAWTRRPEFEVVGREILSYVNILDQIHGIFSAGLESVAIAAGDDSTLAGPAPRRPAGNMGLLNTISARVEGRHSGGRRRRSCLRRTGLAAVPRRSGEIATARSKTKCGTCIPAWTGGRAK